MHDQHRPLPRRVPSCWGKRDIPVRLWVAPPTKMDAAELTKGRPLRPSAAPAPAWRMPGCSLCMGNQAQIARATAMSTSTRNFPNRLGKNTNVFLGSAEWPPSRQSWAASRPWRVPGRDRRGHQGRRPGLPVPELRPDLAHRPARPCPAIATPPNPLTLRRRRFSAIALLGRPGRRQPPQRRRAEAAVAPRPPTST